MAVSSRSKQEIEPSRDSAARKLEVGLISLAAAEQGWEEAASGTEEPVPWISIPGGPPVVPTPAEQTASKPQDAIITSGT